MSLSSPETGFGLREPYVGRLVSKYTYQRSMEFRIMVKSDGTWFWWLWVGKRAPLAISEFFASHRDAQEDIERFKDNDVIIIRRAK